MTQTGTKSELDGAPRLELGEELVPEFSPGEARAKKILRLRLLWNEKRFVGRATVAGLLIGTLLAFVLPTRFESTTRLMPPEGQSGQPLAMLAALVGKAGGGGGGLGALGADLLGLKSTGAQFIGILRSRTVQDRLVVRFNLKKVYWFVRWDEDARQRLDDNTSISEDRKSGIITITVTDSDPMRATAMAQGYVEELDRLVAQLTTSAAHRERVFLENRLKVVKLELDQASKDFSQFASKNVAIDIKEQGKAMVEGAAVLQGQLIATESELKGLEEIYTPQNVRVRSLQARVGELKRQLQMLGGQLDQQGEVSGNVDDSLYPSIRKLPLLGVTYFDLFRRTKIQEVVFEMLTQQYELAKVQEAKEIPSVKVLDVARVPEKRSFPPRLLLIFLCTFLAVAGCSLWVFGRARWEETDSEDPGKLLATEVLLAMNSNMPWAPPNGSRFQAMTHRVWTKLVRRNGTAEHAE